MESLGCRGRCTSTSDCRSVQVTPGAVQVTEGTDGEPGMQGSLYLNIIRLQVSTGNPGSGQVAWGRAVEFLLVADQYWEH